jgi:hypothetical protein
LNIEQIFIKENSKIQKKILKKIGASFRYCWKAFDGWDFLKVISYFLELRWVEY